jgi:hypothetical protein
MTVDALARDLGIAPSTLRNWLRRSFPRAPSERGKPWAITDEIVAAARDRWPGEPAAPPPAAPAPPVAVEAPRPVEEPRRESVALLDDKPPAEAPPAPPPARPAARREREPLWLDAVGGDSFARQKLPARLRRTEAPRPRKQRLSVHAQYVLELVDELVGEPGWRDHRFRWLTEDEPDDERRRMSSPLLPVDAYYPSRQLVVQYRDRRQAGDRRREQLIPRQGIALVTITPEVLATDRRGRVAQRRDADARAIEALLERAGAGARTADDVKRERLESAVTRSWQLQVSGLAMLLLVVGAFVLAAARGESQFLLNVGGALAAFGIAFDVYARVIGVLAARAHGETGWMWACGVLGSPAVFAHAALRRHGPSAPEVGSLAGLLGFTVVLALLLASLAGSVGG